MFEKLIAKPIYYVIRDLMELETFNFDAMYLEKDFVKQCRRENVYMMTLINSTSFFPNEIKKTGLAPFNLGPKDLNLEIFTGLKALIFNH